MFPKRPCSICGKNTDCVCSAEIDNTPICSSECFDKHCASTSHLKEISEEEFEQPKTDQVK